EAAENLAWDRGVRVDEVVPARDARGTQEPRIAERDELRRVRGRTERLKTPRRGSLRRNHDSDGVTAPHQLGCDVECDLLTTADTGVEQVEEDSHACCSGRRAYSRRAG